MSLNKISENSPLISQPINDNFDYIDSYMKNIVIDKTGYGVKSGLEVTAQSSPNMVVTVNTGIAYLPSGRRVEIPKTNLTIANPTTVLHTSEIHTTNATGGFTTDLKPITSSTGKYALTGDITVRKTSGNTIVSVSTINSNTGFVDTTLTATTSIKIDYYHGQQRIDVITITEQGNLQVLSGTPSESNPQTPVVPPTSLKLAEIRVLPKINIGIEKENITNLNINNGIFIDSNGGVVIGKDLTVLGMQSIGGTVNETVVVRDSLYNDQANIPLKINDDLSVSGNITAVGNINGRNVTVDGNTLDSHIAKVANTTSTTTALDKHVSNAQVKGWEDHKNLIGNPHNTSHNQLASIGQADATSTNATKDKHVSNAQAKGWEDHKNSSHLALGETSATAYRGDRGRSAYNHSISTGNAHSTTHAQLSGIGVVNTASTTTVVDKHISNILAKGWEDHKNAIGNAHSMAHAQLSSVGKVDITSVDTTLDKHISNNLARGWEDHRNATSPHSGHATKTDVSNHTSNVKNPHNVTHSQTNPSGVNTLSTDEAKDKHVSNALAKSWEDHRSASAPHVGHAPISHVGSGGTSHALASDSVAGFMSSANYNKLAGIETGATADMTANEILAAIKTVDGVGSGLDADLFGGVLPSAYAKVVHSHGDLYYTETEVDSALKLKLNAVDYTGSDILAKLIVVDGAGSGLDADLLDGKHASAFSLSGHNHDGSYYTESEMNTKLNAKLDKVTYTANDVLAKLKTVHGLDSGLDAEYLGGVAYTGYSRTGHTHDDRYYTETEINTKLSGKLNSSVYTASDVLAKIKSVDGIGSGLDADLFGGAYPSSYSKAGHTHDDRYYTESEMNTKLNAKLNKATYTASDVLAKVKSVDGANSGLDADLIKGVSITVGATAPKSPKVNDLFIDIS